MKHSIKNNPIPSMISTVRFLQTKMINEKLKECGMDELHSSYGGIIHTLLHTKEMSMKDLAREIKRDASTVTVLVRNLEKKGYVKKIENEKDTRSKLISLTEKSKDLCENFDIISERINADMFAGFDDDEISQLTEYLNRIIDNLNGDNK